MKIVLPIFTIFLLFFGRLYGQAPPWIWAQEAYSNGSEYGWDVAADTVSNMVYVGGTFNGNISTSYGPSFTAPYGQDDGFLAKYTTAGIFQWALKVGGTTNDQVKSVAVDPAGDVYVCGYFNGTADFDPSATTFNLTSAGVQDGFLAKYSSTGNFLWAVKYGGSGNDEPWRMYADGNGIYITGSYANAPVIFDSYSSGVTKTTTSANTNGEVFGVKYNSAGVAQWAISGGGIKIDCGYNVVADANNVYFLGRYDDDITFKNSSGTSSAVLQAQQSNKQQVFIVAYTQATGTFVWQTNITCSQLGNDVVGWGIAQDASDLYVTGYLDDDINFKYPSPTLTQSSTSGGTSDIFLAKLSKTGTFIWRAAVTGSGAGEQVGKHVEVDHNGNIILTGTFKSSLNYSAGGGPTLTANAKDLFAASYSNTGIFQWAAMAGANGDDELYGSAVDNTGGIYITGDHDNGAVFGAYTLTDGGNDNIYVAKIGCNTMGNNTITANQTICSGNAPSSLIGSFPTGSGLYTYVWEKSPDNSTWTNATGTFTNQNYAPPTLTVNTYYRRQVIVTGTCASTLISSSILITVDAPPTVSNAGTTQTLCSGTTTLAANTPISGAGTWSVLVGAASVTNSTSPTSGVTGLSNGTNQFVWTISNGVCPSSISTVTITKDIPPTISNAGTSQILCATSATLNANTPTTGTGLWSVASGTGSVSNPTFTNSAVTGLSYGNNQFVWTVYNGVCTSSSSTVTITRDIPPTVSNAGASQTICSASTTLNSNVPTTGIGLWSVVSGTAVVANSNSSSTNVNGLSNGFNQFVWTIANGVCPSLSDTVLIIRDEMPSLAIAGSDKVICSSIDNLSANIPIVGLGTWSIISGTSSINNISLATSSVSNLSTGINSFIWNISNGVCPVSHDTVIISVDVFPTIADAGINKTVCSDICVMEGNPLTIGSGIWSVISGNGIFSNATSNNTTLIDLGTGANTFRWTTQNGVCPVSFADVTIVRDIPPSSADAGIDIETENPITQLQATTPSVGTGYWSVIEGYGIIDNASQSSISVSNLSTGNNVFRWTVSNGSCPVSTDDIVVYLDPLKIPNAFSPNGDEINDRFVVPGLEFYNDVKFTVFNRWSALVYENNNYKNEWSGTNQSNEPLTDDTYYYTLQIPSIEIESKGFIIIKKTK